MPKNIVVCTDGTWARPGSTDSGSSFLPDDTNVCKFFSLLPADRLDFVQLSVRERSGVRVEPPQ